jgi:hypothetical protein
MAYQMQAMDPQSVPGRIQAALKSPQLQRYIELLADMFSHEVFIFGDASCTDALKLAQEIISATRYGPASAQLAGRGQEMNEKNLMAAVLLKTLAANAERVKPPELIVGFRVTKRAAFQEELAKLEQLAKAMLAQLPPLANAINRAKIGADEYLTLTLDGTMIPWDQLPSDELRKLVLQPGDVEKLVARLKKATFTLAIGLHGDYLLVAMGPATGALEKLGAGKRLLDRPELRPLAKFADRRLIGVSYASPAMSKQLQSFDQDIDDLVKFISEAIGFLPLPEDQKTRINKDLAALAMDLKGEPSAIGANMAFSFLTPNGIENYNYDWGDHSYLDGSKPLPLLRHVGGSPLWAVVGREKHSPQQYDALVKWLKIGYGYFEDFALPQMPAVDRANFEKFWAEARPLLGRLDKANREMLLPALADGQTALVIDAKLESKHFIQTLPPTPQPMPMLELALLSGVSDEALLRKAFAEYQAVGNALLDALRRIEGSQVPADLKIPDPEVSAVAGGTIYRFPLPKDWGVDPKIAPNFGLSPSVGIFSLSPAHTARLLHPTPLNAGGALANPDKPLAGAMVFNSAAMVDAVRPWVKLLLDSLAEKAAPNDQQQYRIVGEHVHAVLDVLKVLRTVTSESYFEDGALVSHVFMEFRDVK